MSGPLPGTLPFEPLARILAHHLPEITVAGCDGRPVTISAGDDHRAAALLDVSRRTLLRWKAGQKLNHYNADRAAIRLGLHPLDIWPNWQDDLIHALDLEPVSA